MVKKVVVIIRIINSASVKRSALTATYFANVGFPSASQNKIEDIMQYGTWTMATGLTVKC